MASGPDTANPHSSTDGPLGACIPLIVDIVAQHRDSSHHADGCRTFVVGEPPSISTFTSGRCVPWTVTTSSNKDTYSPWNPPCTGLMGRDTNRGRVRDNRCGLATIEHVRLRAETTAVAPRRPVTMPSQQMTGPVVGHSSLRLYFMIRACFPVPRSRP
ncbi:hypothetical protein [Natrinema gelatinilyticum]|uniref:hypothetical protein n=1 Tax=Natrinema gelatinilyticum TaxID=2961571 RepID=UPI003CE58DF5